MTLVERFAAQPWVFMLGCLVWIPIAIWIIALLHWAIAGDVDVITMFAGMGAAVALGYFTTNPPDPRMTPVLFTVVMGTVVVFPFARMSLNRRAHVMLEAEQAERAYEILKRSPDNIGARMKLAKVLFVRGMAGHAVTIGEETLRNLPRQTFLDDFREVEKWRYQAKDPALFRALPCLNCRTMNPPGTIFCNRCHAPYLTDLIRGAWTKGGLGRKLVAVWILAVLVFVGIPSAALLTSPLIASVLIVLQGLLGIGVSILGLRERKV